MTPTKVEPWVPSSLKLLFLNQWELLIFRWGLQLIGSNLQLSASSWTPKSLALFINSGWWNPLRWMEIPGRMFSFLCDCETEGNFRQKIIHSFSNVRYKFDNWNLRKSHWPFFTSTVRIKPASPKSFMENQRGGPSMRDLFLDHTMMKRYKKKGCQGSSSQTFGYDARAVPPNLKK